MDKPQPQGNLLYPETISHTQDFSMFKSLSIAVSTMESKYEEISILSWLSKGHKIREKVEISV